MALPSLGVIPYPTAFNNGVKRHFEDDPKLRQELLFRSRCPRELGTVTKSGGNDLYGARRISTRPLPARLHPLRRQRAMRYRYAAAGRMFTLVVGAERCRVGRCANRGGRLLRG